MHVIEFNANIITQIVVIKYVISYGYIAKSHKTVLQNMCYKDHFL